MNYPTEAEFVAMTPDEFESFWNAYKAFLCGPEETPRMFRPVDHRHVLPGFYADDLPKIFRLKRAGWTPCNTWRDNSHGGYACWPAFWEWINPETREKHIGRHAYEVLSAKQVSTP